MIIPPRSNITSGFHHWSSGFLQIELGRRDVTGIVGRMDEMIHNPFVNDPKNQNPIGPGRKKMFGIEIGRPTMILDLVAGDWLEDSCITVRDMSGVRQFVDDSGKLEEKAAFDASLECVVFTQLQGLNALGDAPSSIEQLHENQVIRLRLEPMGLDEDRKFELRIKSLPSDESNFTFGETSPPMPLLGRPLAVYQISEDEYRFQFDCEDRQTFDLDSAQVWTAIQVAQNAQGRTLLYLNGVQVMEAEGCPRLQRISIGKGWKSRYWTGKIGDVKLNSQHVEL